MEAWKGQAREDRFQDEGRENGLFRRAENHKGSMNAATNRNDEAAIYPRTALVA
jgi:hypothetical protein